MSNDAGAEWREAGSSGDDGGLSRAEGSTRGNEGGNSLDLHGSWLGGHGIDRADEVTGGVLAHDMTNKLFTNDGLLNGNVLHFGNFYNGSGLRHGDDVFLHNVGHGDGVVVPVGLPGRELLDDQGGVIVDGSGSGSGNGDGLSDGNRPGSGNRNRNRSGVGQGFRGVVGCLLVAPVVPVATVVTSIFVIAVVIVSIASTVAAIIAASTAISMTGICIGKSKGQSGQAKHYLQMTVDFLPYYSSKGNE